MKILLTGGTGFVGSQLAQKLIKNGYSVRALVRNPKKLRWPLDDKIELVKGDITKAEGLEEALKGIEIIIHCAGLTKALKYNDYYNANAKSCELLLSAIDKKSFKQFIFLSTQAALGPSIKEPKFEDEEQTPISYYGESKLEGEKILTSSKVNYTIFRPCAIYGERDVEFYPLFKAIRKGWKLIVGNGKKKVNMLNVHDLINAIISCINNKRAFKQIYNIADGNEYNWKDVNNAAEKAVGKKCRFLRIPIFVVSIVGWINTFLERILRKPFLLNKQKLKEMKQDAWLMNIDKIKKDLDYKASFTLEQGFRAAFKWYVENKWIKKLKK